MPRDSDPGRALAPMLATATDALPRGSGWAFEPKWDGYRALVRVAAGEATLRSRNGNDLTPRFPGVARALALAVRAPGAVLDGEVCALDDTGRSDFGRLQRGEGALAFVAFDLLELDGEPLLRRSYLERRSELARLLDPPVAGVLLSPSFDDGAALEQAAREHGLEGVVAKRVASTYQPGRRSPDWRKLKLKQRQEAVIAGFTRGKGRRAPGSGRSCWGCTARTGCASPAASERGSATRSSTGWRSSSPHSDKRTAHLSRCRGFHACVEGSVTWVEPLLVAEIEFAEWTRDGRLRAPVYLGLRDDKPAEDVVAERVPLPEEIRRGARVLRLSNLDKPFWPEEGISKGDLLAFYRDVAPVLVPHLRGRPFTMKRYPDGWQGKHFFQKDAPSHMPDWIPRAPFPASTRDGERRTIDYPLVNDELALLWMVNMGCIDLNAWASRVDRPDRPDWVMFDLDPSEDVGFPEVIEVALLVKQTLDLVGLESFPKTSGSRGIHVLVPIARRHGYDETRAVRLHRRRRARAGASRPRHDGMGEAEAPRGARRREPERAREDDGDGLLRTPPARRARLDAARVGRGAPGARSLSVHVRRGAHPDRTTRRPLRAGADAASVARRCAALARLIGAEQRQGRLEPWCPQPEAEGQSDVDHHRLRRHGSKLDND